MNVYNKICTNHYEGTTIKTTVKGTNVYTKKETQDKNIPYIE